HTPMGTGARLIYPNTNHRPAGTRFDFWQYDADTLGWYIYGKGTVTPNATQVLPDQNVSVYEFTGAMLNDGSVPPPSAPPPGCGGGCCDPASGPNGPGSGGCGGGGGGGGGGDGSYGGEPVSLPTGLFVLRNTDVFLPDSIPIRITRTYRPGDEQLR